MARDLARDVAEIQGEFPTVDPITIRQLCDEFRTKDQLVSYLRTHLDDLGWKGLPAKSAPSPQPRSPRRPAKNPVNPPAKPNPVWGQIRAPPPLQTGLFLPRTIAEVTIPNSRFGLIEHPEIPRQITKCEGADIIPSQLTGPGEANPAFCRYPPFWGLPPGTEAWPVIPQFSFMQMVFPPPYVPAAAQEPDE